MRKELFVCDRCGHRSRLDSTKRHWCTICVNAEETELRPVRIKKPEPV
jgi:ribosomal protein L37E